MNPETLLLLWSLTLGGVPRGALLSQDSASYQFVDYGRQAYTDLNMRLMYRQTLYVGGSSKIMVKSGDYDLKPTSGLFSLSLGLKTKGLEIGYIHECTHPVFSSSKSGTVFYDGSDKVFVKLSGLANVL